MIKINKPKLKKRLSDFLEAWEIVPDRIKVIASLVSDAVLIIAAAGIARLVDIVVNLLFPDQVGKDIVVPILEGITSVSTVGAVALYITRDFAIAVVRAKDSFDEAIRIYRKNKKLGDD